VRQLISLVLFAMLAACSGGDHEDLKDWITQNGKDLRGTVKKIPEVSAYQAIAYDVEGLIDPFKANKIEPESKNKQGAGKGGEYQPDFDARDLRNNILEKYPLESLKMIGTLNVNNRPMAVIQVEDKVKQVRVGEYVGLDFGMVTRITDKDIELRELIQDAAGDWSERNSTLYLQSKDGGKK
jgi:type IV pilus assembly protein PilP